MKRVLCGVDYSAGLGEWDFVPGQQQMKGAALNCMDLMGSLL